MFGARVLGKRDGLSVKEYYRIDFRQMKSLAGGCIVYTHIPEKNGTKTLIIFSTQR